MEQPQFDNLNLQSGLTGAVASLIGGRVENQDSYLIAETPLGLFVLLTDGLGGGPAGKTASLQAARAMVAALCEQPASADVTQALHDCVVAANNALLRAGMENPALQGMATTCVGALIREGMVYIVHVGDSRAYVLRDDKVAFRTDDHSYVAEQVRLGKMTEEVARKSNYSSILRRAIGGEPHINPEVNVVYLAVGDRIVLMTDGIWGAMPEPKLIEALSKPGLPDEIVREVVADVDAIGSRSRKGYDNMTLAMIQLPEEMDPTGWVTSGKVIASSDSECLNLFSENNAIDSYDIDAAPDRSGSSFAADSNGENPQNEVNSPSQSGIMPEIASEERTKFKWAPVYWGLALIFIGVVGLCVWLYFFDRDIQQPPAIEQISDTLKKDSVASDSVAKLPARQPEDPSMPSEPAYYASAGNYSYTPDNEGEGLDETPAVDAENLAEPEVAAKPYESTLTHSNPNIQEALRKLDELRQNYPSDISQAQNPDEIKERMGERIEKMKIVIDNMRAYRGSLAGDAPNRRGVNDLIQRVQRAQSIIGKVEAENGQPSSGAKSEINALMDAINQLK